LADYVDATLEDIQKGILKPCILQMHPSADSENIDVPLYLNTLLPVFFICKREIIKFCQIVGISGWI